MRITYSSWTGFDHMMAQVPEEVSLRSSKYYVFNLKKFYKFINLVLFIFNLFLTGPGTTNTIPYGDRGSLSATMYVGLIAKLATHMQTHHFNSEF